MIIGIYKITSCSGRVYIGQSMNILRRKHRYSLLRCKKQVKLYNSIKKYGWEKHIFKIIEECSVENLNIRERYWQEYYDCVENGLNCRYTKTDDKSGVMSEESKKKLSISLTGRKLSSLTKTKISNSKKGKPIRKPKVRNNVGVNNSFYGKTHNKKSKVIMSKNRKGLLKGESNGRSRKLINSETKVVYDCIKCAAEELNIKVGTLRAMLSGIQKNTSKLVYLDDNKISSLL